MRGFGPPPRRGTIAPVQPSLLHETEEQRTGQSSSARRAGRWQIRAQRLLHPQHALNASKKRRPVAWLPSARDPLRRPGRFPAAPRMFQAPSATGSGCRGPRPARVGVADDRQPSQRPVEDDTPDTPAPARAAGRVDAPAPRPDRRGHRPSAGGAADGNDRSIAPAPRDRPRMGHGNCRPGEPQQKSRSWRSRTPARRSRSESGETGPCPVSRATLRERTGMPPGDQSMLLRGPRLADERQEGFLDWSRDTWPASHPAREETPPARASRCPRPGSETEGQPMITRMIASALGPGRCPP
jgi:hypothetical protein